MRDGVGAMSPTFNITSGLLSAPLAVLDPVFALARREVERMNRRRVLVEQPPEKLCLVRAEDAVGRRPQIVWICSLHGAITHHDKPFKHQQPQRAIQPAHPHSPPGASPNN